MGFLEDQANLSGRVAVVVGGASGIGEAITLALASAGVDVAFCDINAAAGSATRARVEALGRQALAGVTDATDPAALDGFYAEVARTFKRVDILVNVVGGVSQRPFLDATAQQCAADIQRNYRCHSLPYSADFLVQIPQTERCGPRNRPPQFSTWEVRQCRIE